MRYQVGKFFKIFDVRQNDFLVVVDDGFFGVLQQRLDVLCPGRRQAFEGRNLAQRCRVVEVGDVSSLLFGSVDAGEADFEQERFFQFRPGGQCYKTFCVRNLQIFVAI